MIEKLDLKLLNIINFHKAVDKINEIIDHLPQGKHDCEKWRLEGMGCSICGNSHLTVKEIKEVQEHCNWRITSLKEEIEKLKQPTKEVPVCPTYPGVKEVSDEREALRIILWKLEGYGKQRDGTNFFPDDFIGEKMERTIDKISALYRKDVI